jgi:hypothetical protein
MFITEYYYPLYETSFSCLQSQSISQVDDFRLCRPYQTKNIAANNSAIKPAHSKYLDSNMSVPHASRHPLKMAARSIMRVETQLFRFFISSGFITF